jgi:hypothetical protein
MIFWDPDYDFDLQVETMETVAGDLYRWRNLDALHGGKVGNYIRAVHTTDRDMPFEGISDGVFLDLNKYLLGNYVVVCGNGREARIPLHYGECIAGMNDRFGAQKKADGGAEADGGYEMGIEKLKGVSYRALPVERDGKTWYEAILRMPDFVRGLEIKEVRFEKTATDCEVWVESIEVV